MRERERYDEKERDRKTERQRETERMSVERHREGDRVTDIEIVQ